MTFTYTGREDMALMIKGHFSGRWFVVIRILERHNEEDRCVINSFSHQAKTVQNGF